MLQLQHSMLPPASCFLSMTMLSTPTPARPLGAERSYSDIAASLAAIHGRAEGGGDKGGGQRERRGGEGGRQMREGCELHDPLT